MGRRIKLAAYAAVIAAAFYVLPQGKRALDLNLAADDPARLADLQLADRFSAEFAEHEIAAALDRGDIAHARSPAMQSSRAAGNFGRVFITGQTDDGYGLAGAAAGDLIGWGDVRDLAREGWHALSGQEVNRLLVGMSAVGLAVTAWTYLSAGAAVPVREGLTVVKAAGRAERLGKGLVESVGRSVTNGGAERVGVALADLGTVESKAGTRATLQGLREVEGLSEVSKLKQLASVKGRSTLAILKMFGRKALVFGAVAVAAAGWIMSATVNLFLIALAILSGFITLVRMLWPTKIVRSRPMAVAAVAATD